MRIALSLALWLAASVASQAASHTWTGASSASNTWSDAANWQNGVPVSSGTTDVVFVSAGNQSAANPNSFQDLPPSPFQLTGLTFSLSGSSPFILSGSSVGGGSSLTLTQNSAAEVTISNVLMATFSYLFGGDGAGIVNLSGSIPINGQSSLTKSGASKVRFNATSQFYNAAVNGGTVVQAGQQFIGRFLTVASTTGTAATYNLIGGSLSAGNGETIGGSGAGIFNQTSGTNSAGALVIDNSGTYNLSGGDIQSVSTFTVKTGGTFNQSGGTFAPAFATVQSGGTYVIGGGSTGHATVNVGSASGSPALLIVTGSGTPSLGNLNLDATGSVAISGGGRAFASAGLTNPAGSNPTVFISGTGALTIGGTTGFHASTFSGSIRDGDSGPGGINVIGQGQTIFSGSSTYTGPTNVSTGLIGGTGSLVSTVTLSGSATISPGILVTSGSNAGMTDAGQFRIGSLVMNAATTFQVTINGPAVGQFDLLHVTNNVTLLNGALLSLQLNYTPAFGQSFLILEVTGTNPISGFFANALEGGRIVANGQSFDVTYKGGNGNDLVLSVPEPSALSLLAAVAIGGVGCWRRATLRFVSRRSKAGARRES